MPFRLALIDNYDSYTYNLAHLLAVANESVPPAVIPADSFPNLTALTHAHGDYDAYILSPGPGHPANHHDFPSLERDIISNSKFPVLGVCLGHQALCLLHGASISKGPAGPVHGAISRVHRLPAGHDCPLLRGLPYTFSVVRYHSLCVDPPSLPSQLLPTAWAIDFDDFGNEHKVLMAVRHRSTPHFGVQFHPESVCTEVGKQIAHNFLNITGSLSKLRTIPRPLLKSPERDSTQVQLETIIKKITNVTFEADTLFRELYGDHETAFWLDSSSSSSMTASLSRCSSPELDASSAEDLTKLEKNSVDNRGGRFSIMGSLEGPLSELVTYDVNTTKVSVQRHQPESRTSYFMTIFDYLSSSLKNHYSPSHPDLPLEMNGGYIGYFGYELKNDIEGVRGNIHSSNLPDAWFIFADRIVLIDHHEDNIYLVALTKNTPHLLRMAENWLEDTDAAIRQIGTKTPKMMSSAFTPTNAPHVPETLVFTPERSRRQYLEDIAQSHEKIRTGESYEICLTNRLRTQLPDNNRTDPLEIYTSLRLVNPAPYSAFLRISSDVAVCCSSPERFLRISSLGEVESKPIKGTLPRGRNLEEDAQLREALRSSEKDRRENLMIVDLVRNDLSRTCAIDTVHVPSLMNVESFATVHQLVSTVRGSLQNSIDTVECIKSSYPMGSMTGAPKIRTMEIIDQLEQSSRGIYSGSIGYLSACGAADLNVVIRTAVLQKSSVEIGVGGAIVALSNSEEEYEEVILKGNAIMQSLAMTITGTTNFVIQHEEHGKMQENRQQKFAVTVQ